VIQYNIITVISQVKKRSLYKENKKLLIDVLLGVLDRLKIFVSGYLYIYVIMDLVGKKVFEA